jgi:DNA-binding GntR family transcriptional regulator
VLDEVVTEHERIVDAIEARDPSAAIRALNDHLDRSDYDAPAERRRDRVTVTR